MKKLSKHEIKNNVKLMDDNRLPKLGALVYNRATKQYNFSRQPYKHANLNVILPAKTVAKVTSTVKGNASDPVALIDQLVDNLYELAEPNTFVTGEYCTLKDLYIKMSNWDRGNRLVISLYKPTVTADQGIPADDKVTLTNTAEDKVSALEHFGSLTKQVFIVD